jgi:hypothetical protein
MMLKSLFYFCHGAVPLKWKNKVKSGYKVDQHILLEPSLAGQYLQLIVNLNKTVLFSIIITVTRKGFPSINAQIAQMHLRVFMMLQ